MEAIDPIFVIGAALFGVLIGVLSGMLGIGGGMQMVPLFRMVYGMSAMASTATSLFCIIPTSISGFITHIRKGTCVVPVGVCAGLGGACTSVIGVLLASKSPEWMVMVVTACIICYGAYTMLTKARKAPKLSELRAQREAEQAAAAAAASEEVEANGAAEAGATSTGESAAAPTAVTSEPFVMSFKRVVQSFFIGFAAGIFSGYIGVGGGFIMVPLFSTVFAFDMKHASGTSLLGIVILAIPAVVEQFALGNVSLVVGLITVVGSVPGAILGANLVQKMPERILRFAFAALMLAVGVTLAVTELM